MKIIQITDLHIGREDEETMKVDVRSNFLNILDKVKEANPDLLVISGDLCFDQPDISIYQWIKNQLAAFEIPYLVIPGNHDESTMLANSFQIDGLLKNGELFFLKKWENWTCLFLDSAVGKMSEKQYSFIENTLSEAKGNVLIFVHHPTAKAGVTFMDNKHPFQEIDRIQRAFSKFDGPLNIFCGHFHVDKAVQFKNQNIFITPSCYVQIDPNEIDFKVDHYRIGYREIELLEDRLLTGVYYIN